MSATILNLYRLLDDLETMFFPMADDKRLRLVFERGPEVPQYVRADEVKLRQVLTNLLSIALESTSQGSVLLRTDTVVHSPQGSADLRLSFTIEDTGSGMAAQDVKELSNSSVPGGAGRHVPENSDLALAISFRYVQLLGGTLNIESQVGHGTTVAFDIPVDPIGPDRDVARANQKSRSVLALAHGQPHWRVLVADERRAARLLLVRLLAPVGFDVREAGNGQEVIDTWQAWQPHLILMDLGMLAMDGREAAQRIKAGSEGRAPIIIALAASSFKQPRRALLQAGCDDFLSKPFQDADLYEMLRKHLSVQYVYADEPVGMAHSDAGSGEVAPAETMAQVSDRNREGISGPKGTILIVDDSPALLESLMTLLTDQGYTVHTFLDGNLALKFVDSTLPDLVLLDVLMPGMDGYQVCRHLKARERTRDIPIIFLTVITETLDKVQGFRLGAVDYITRPFEAEEVLARVTTHLALRRQQKQLEAQNKELQQAIAVRERSERALQEARAHLEQRVADRTTELARANATLKSEIAEHKRAEEALRKRLEDIAILHALATVGAESTSEDELIERALQVMARSADKRKVGLLLLDNLAGTLRAFRSLRGSQDGADADQRTAPLGQGLAGQVAADGRPRRVADLTHEEQYFQAHSDTRSMLCVALKVDERVIGVIQAESALADAFVEADEDLLTTCAEQLATAIEKIRLVQAEAQRRQEVETLRQVASVISASTDRSAVLGLILDQLKRVVPYDSASVMLISGDLLDMVAQRGLQPEKPFPAPVRLENFPHLGQVLGHRQPVMIADTVADARWQASPHTSHIRCWLGVPLVIQDKVIGLLNVDKAQPGFYTENDASLAMAFADYAGIALENARLFDQIRRRAQDLEALEAISSGLRQAGTREAMLQFIVEKSVEALSGDAGALLQVEGRMLVLKAEYGRSTGLLGRPHLAENCAHWQAVRTGETLYIIDVAGQNGSSCQCGICGAMMRDMAMGVVIPLKTAEATVGLLHLVFGSRREFSAEKRHMLATIAEITGSALHRAGILETLEQRVADRTRELAALYEVTAVSSEALDLQTMLERSLERVLKAMRSSIATIHLLDERDETLSLAAYQTIAPADLAEIDFSPPAPHIKEWLIVRGEPLVIPDMASGSQTSWATGVSRACTYAGAPMRARGRRLGVLSVARDADQQFSIEEVALLASIADQVAVAVENARLHQHAEQMAIVEERARLARELHDSVTQCLSSVTLLAQAASDFSKAGEWGRVKHYLERIRDTGGQALKEMRLLLYELQPPSTEQVDLVEMLTRRLDAVEERAGVNVQLLTEDWLRLPALAEEALYRIALEALNNALKHSGASMATIVLRGNPDGADLEVNDNGIGFDPDSVKRKGGIGLLSMQQRAKRLGGRLTIRSAPGEGTSIKVSLGTRQ